MWHENGFLREVATCGERIVWTGAFAGFDHAAKSEPARVELSGADVGDIQGYSRLQ